MISRRRTLIAAAALATLLAGRGWPFSERGAAASLVRSIRARASARIIGAAYLATHPDEADAAILCRAIAADLATAAPRDQAELDRALANRVRADFLQRRTVKVDGWVLSRTEARLCALCRFA
jgi:hypothetical protein